MPSPDNRGGTISPRLDVVPGSGEKKETAEKADFKCGPHIGSIFSGSSAYLNRNRLALKFLTCLMRWKQHLSHRFCKRCIFDWAEIKDLPRSVESYSAELDE